MSSIDGSISEGGGVWRPWRDRFSDLSDPLVGVSAPRLIFHPLNLFFVFLFLCSAASTTSLPNHTGRHPPFGHADRPSGQGQEGSLSQTPTECMWKIYFAISEFIGETNAFPF